MLKSCDKRLEDYITNTIMHKPTELFAKARVIRYI